MTNGQVEGFDIIIDIAPNGATLPSSHVDLPIEIDIEAAGGLNQGGTVDLPIEIDIEATGRINDEANKFGAVDMEVGIEIDPTTTAMVLRGKVHALLEIDMTVAGTNTEADRGTLIITLDTADPQNAGNYRTKEGRVKINGTEVPFVQATYTEAENSSGATLEVQLARRSDKDLLVVGAEFEFAIGNRLSAAFGDWDEATMEIIVAVGELISSEFSLAWNQGPQDTVSFSSIGDISKKLLTTPATDTVIYDNLKQTIQISDFKTLYDTLGRAYVTELVPIPAMTLHQMLQFVLLTECGFSNLVMNLPDFPVERVNCKIGQKWIDAIKGYVGMFTPDIYVDLSGKIHIEDSTNAYPAGFPTPPDLTLSEVVTEQISSQLQKVDAIRVLYNETNANYDIVTTRSEIPPERTNGIPLGVKGYLSTTGERFIFEYRRSSNPNVILAERLERETTSTVNYLLEVVAETEEVSQYDSSARLTSRTKTVRQLTPVLSGTPTTPPVSQALQNVSTESELREYQSHPFKKGQMFQSFRSLDVSGIIAYDPTTPQLGASYKQSLIDAIESGNVTDQTIVGIGPMRTRTEDASPNQDGTVSVRVLDYNHLTDQMPFQSTDTQPADIGISALNSQTNEILVLSDDTSDRTTDQVMDLHCGEMPVLEAIALARRILKKAKTKPRRFSAPFIGHDRTLRKGAVRRVVERDSVVVGIFKIESRTITCNSSGITTTVSGKEV